ncbi:MAG: hypothetical protein Q9168_004497 [Polycauliona sp. 1 TL-2023]
MSSSPDLPDLDGMAASLVKRLSIDFACELPKSSVSESIYSTAWVSMIRSPSESTGYWLFPQAFDCILERQLDSGGWSSLEESSGNRAWDVDRILHTMAALLALLIRRASKVEVPNGIEERIARADTSLRSMLQGWDVRSSDNAGFEILAPAHLDMLEKYDLRYQFPCHSHLLRLCEQKLQKVKPEQLYGKEPSTMLFCLESLIGKIDFDRIAHHKVNGSILYAPSSTAAYLMNTSVWDVEAEAYLRTSFQNSGVPEFSPSNIFEITWSLEVLLDNFPKELLACQDLHQIADFLENIHHAQKGLVGWTPGAIDDSDDTSLLLYVLNHLDRSISPDALIDRYESSDRFRCYAVETTPSLSANAHVLKSFLRVRNPSQYTSQIIKAATYILDRSWQGDLSDKWTMTAHYTMLMICQSLEMLLRRWEQGLLPDIPGIAIVQRIPPSLLAIAVEVLQSQHDDGSWGYQSRETTAYAMLSLAVTAPLPLCQCLGEQIGIAIGNGKRFLLTKAQDWAKTDLVWMSKTTYGLGIVAEAYTLAAMNINLTDNHSFGKLIEDMCKAIAKPPLKSIEKLACLPLLSGMPRWLFDACIIEYYHGLPAYTEARRSVSTGQVTQQRHFDIFPFAMIASSRLGGASMAPNANLEFMVLCALSFELDYYTENYVAGLEARELAELQDRVRGMFEEQTTDIPSNLERDDTSTVAQPQMHQHPELNDIVIVFRRLVSWVLNHPIAQLSSPYDRANLRAEMKAFCLAQIMSIQKHSSVDKSCEIHKDPRQQRSSTLIPVQSYHQWVHGTASAHGGASLGFALVTCLLGAGMKGRECFENAEAKYLARELDMHLAALVRMENDVGSVRRDRKEGNLNSVDFEEFGIGDAEEEDLQTKLRSLRRLAAYERGCAEVALEKLNKAGVAEKVLRGLKACSNAVDLFGQIYAMEDISPSLERCG